MVLGHFIARHLVLLHTLFDIRVELIPLRFLNSLCNLGIASRVTAPDLALLPIPLPSLALSLLPARILLNQSVCVVARLDFGVEIRGTLVEIIADVILIACRNTFNVTNIESNCLILNRTNSLALSHTTLLPPLVHMPQLNHRQPAVLFLFFAVVVGWILLADGDVGAEWRLVFRGQFVGLRYRSPLRLVHIQRQLLNI